MLPRDVVVCGLCLASAAAAQPDSTAAVLRLSLDECVEMALDRSPRRPVARSGLEAARALRRQAGSGYWPQVDLVSSLSRRDEDPLFVFPEDTDIYSFDLLSQALATEVTIPEKRLVLQDRLHFVADANLVLPLYAGGLRRSLVRQAEAGVDAATEVSRRTDLDVVHDVRHAYYRAVLAQRLLTIGRDTLARLTVTLQLTENLYLEGSGTVDKTDWLEHKLAVDAVRAVVVGLESAVQLARAALAHDVGLEWQRSVEPVDVEVPFQSVQLDLPSLGDAAFRFSPDWARLQHGLRARAAAVDEARSGRKPRLAVLGNVQLIANRHDSGIVDESDKRSWVVALGLEVPVFDGFLTRHRIREASARLAQLEHREVELGNALGLQVRALFIELQRAQNQEEIAREALATAADNESLNQRAYRAGLATVEDVVRTQLTEAAASSLYHKVRFDHYSTRARLEQVIGRELEAILW